MTVALAHHGGQVPLAQPFISSTSTATGLLVLPSSHVGKTQHSLPFAGPSSSSSSQALPSVEPTHASGTASENEPYIQIQFSNSTDISDSPMRPPRRCTMGILASLLDCCGLSSIFGRYMNKNNMQWEYKEDSRWIATSKSWWDRQLCRWIGFCGITHLNEAGWTWNSTLERARQHQWEQAKLSRGGANMSPFWTSGTEDPNEWSEEERGLREIPQYVLDYAPYVHLFSGEHFWPCDIAEHLVHTSPHLNYTLIESMRDDRTLDNLDELNQYGRYVYLQSDDNVEERPGWLGGSKNIPETPGDSNDENSADWPPTPPLIDHLVPESLKKGLHSPESPFRSSSDDDAGGDTDTPPAEHSGGGHSTAPAVLVVIPKADGIVDAFWFYFYSYNLGNQVLNVRFGNHVGDWEHTVVRFQGGEPISVYLSEHNFGTAYTYFAMEKYGKRPVTYSATGTHAMYATPGLHPYVLPWGLLHDQTDRGPLWDPLLNAHSYTYNHTEGILRSSLLTPRAPTSWFYYRGHWGDKFYPLSDPRQYRFAGQYHYVSGPSGPRYKNLGRKDVCQGRGKCTVKNWIGSGDRVQKWPGGRLGEEGEIVGPRGDPEEEGR